MNVISENKTSTVGIVTDPDKLLHIGTFEPHLLKEWFRKVEQLYGLEQEFHLFVRKSDTKEAYVIFASSNGENPFVAVAGKYPDDGKPWGQK